jgi:hypothetical protein
MFMKSYHMDISILQSVQLPLLLKTNLIL